MTPELILCTAAAALRAEPEPTRLHTALAAWLEDTAEQVEFNVIQWRRGGWDVADLAESEYRFPLAVARAVLEERGGA